MSSDSSTEVRVMPLRIRLGNIMAGVVAAGITFLGARFLLAPRVAALGYGIPLASDRDRRLTAVKGVRDVTSGLLLAGALLSGVSDHAPCARNRVAHSTRRRRHRLF